MIFCIKYPNNGIFKVKEIYTLDEKSVSKPMIEGSVAEFSAVLFGIYVNCVTNDSTAFQNPNRRRKLLVFVPAQIFKMLTLLMPWSKYIVFYVYIYTQ